MAASRRKTWHIAAFCYEHGRSSHLFPCRLSEVGSEVESLVFGADVKEAEVLQRHVMAQILMERSILETETDRDLDSTTFCIVCPIPGTGNCGIQEPFIPFTKMLRILARV